MGQCTSSRPPKMSADHRNAPLIQRHPPPSVPLSLPFSQLDLIDLGVHKHRKYRYVMNYTDRYTKFVWLRPLKNKSSAGVARQVCRAFWWACWWVGQMEAGW